MKMFQDWEEAQERAASPDDWHKVDQLAIVAAQSGGLDLLDVEKALRLAIRRMRGTTELPIEPGDPSDIWLHHLLHGVWQAIVNNNLAREHFFTLPFLTHSLSRDNCIVGVSRAWCDLLGYSPCEAVGRKSIEFLTEASRKIAIDKHLPKFWRDGHLGQVSYDMVHKSGRVIPVRMSAVCELGDDGRPLRSVAIISPKNK